MCLDKYTITDICYHPKLEPQKWCGSATLIYTLCDLINFLGLRKEQQNSTYVNGLQEFKDFFNGLSFKIFGYRLISTVPVKFQITTLIYAYMNGRQRPLLLSKKCGQENK
jgi:hypothetical protein